MKHPIHRVQSFEQVGTYSLAVTFEDGLRRTTDFQPVLEGELLGPLRDPAQFAQVLLDREVYTLQKCSVVAAVGQLGRSRFRGWQELLSAPGSVNLSGRSRNLKTRYS